MKSMGILGALLLAFLAGCSATPSGPAASPSTMSTEQILAIGREAAQCMREHGVADFPDPVIDGNGRLALPEGAEGDRAKQALSANPAAQQACEPILDRLPASAIRRHSEGPLSQEDLANLLRFAQCVRQNGIPEWPDPSADGTFPLSGTPLATEGKSARFQAATQACRQYWDQGIRGS